MLGQLSKGRIVLTCDGSTIMRFLLCQQILHIPVPPLDLFAWLKLSGLRFQHVYFSFKVVCQGRGWVFDPSTCFQIG